MLSGFIIIVVSVEQGISGNASLTENIMERQIKRGAKLVSIYNAPMREKASGFLLQQIAFLRVNFQQQKARPDHAAPSGGMAQHTCFIVT